MAIIATLLGGIIGFASFLIALLAFDAGFLVACAIYIMSGFSTTALIIITALIPTRADDADETKAQPA